MREMNDMDPPQLWTVVLPIFSPSPSSTDATSSYVRPTRLGIVTTGAWSSAVGDDEPHALRRRVDDRSRRRELVEDRLVLVLRRQRRLRHLVAEHVEDQVDVEAQRRQLRQRVLRRDAEQVGDDDARREQVDDERARRGDRHVLRLRLEAPARSTKTCHCPAVTPTTEYVVTVP